MRAVTELASFTPFSLTHQAFLDLSGSIGMPTLVAAIKASRKPPTQAASK